VKAFHHSSLELAVFNPSSPPVQQEHPHGVLACGIICHLEAHAKKNLQKYQVHALITRNMADGYVEE